MSTSGGTVAPTASDTTINGGLYIPKGGLDRWAAPGPNSTLTRVVVVGDSVSEGMSVAYWDNFVQRIARTLGPQLGGLKGAGYFGVYRNANFFQSGAEWANTANWLNQAGAAGCLVPYAGSLQVGAGAATDILTFTPPAQVGARAVADAVTNGTTTVTSATATFTANDVGQTIYGTGIPKNSSIQTRVNATTVTIGPLPATTSQSGGVLGLAGRAYMQPTIAGFQIKYVDVNLAGAWSYSLDGGGTWLAGPAMAGPAAAQLKDGPFVASTLASGLKIRAATSAGAGSLLVHIAGVTLYNQATLPTTGVLIDNVSADASTLDATPVVAPLALLGSGNEDRLRLLDNNGNTANTGSLQPDLLIVCYTNDMSQVANGVYTLAQFQADMATLIARVGGYCDVLFVSPFEQSRGAPVTAATQVAFRAALKAAAAANGAACLDIFDSWAAQSASGFAAANTAGYMFDTLHPSSIGHADIAGHLARTLGRSAI